jgi:Cytochrome c554 and c-prime
MRLARRTAVRLGAGVLAAAGFAAATAYLVRHYAPPDTAVASSPVKVEPQRLFDKWPQDRKPDLILVLTGQSYGYLQKCGCSFPQKGGLERRYNFIESLKARGWEVIGLDVGDVTRPLAYTPTPDQTLTKYEVAMTAMKLMGYKAVGVGKEELALPLLNALTKYTLQKGNEYPRVHAANIENKEDFPGPAGGSALTESDVLTAKSGVSVGVMSVAGAELVSKGVDRTVKYNPNAGTVVAKILNTWKNPGPAPDIRVLLYQGPMEWTDPGTGKRADAKTAAEGFPDFHIVLCKTPDDSDGPDMPTVVNEGKTMICQVGQKGQSIGVVGIYKTPTGTELYYQRVVMSEEFETPPDQEGGHPLLKLLQDYSDTVRDNDYLSEMARRKKPHVLQVQNKNAAYVGDGRCQVCHQAEFAVWQKSKHSHAYDALALVAKHPRGRQFDGECIVCHTVGYEYQTGYLNEKTTPHLKNVQCESCHGPAKLHVDEEVDNFKKKKGQTHQFAAKLSPWKAAAGGQGLMPPVAKLEAMAKEKDPSVQEGMLTPAENQVYLSVYDTCQKCHDIDNDPKFKLYDYWPHIVHTGLKKKK